MGKRGMKQGGKKRIVGFREPSSTIHVQCRGGKSSSDYGLSRGFSVRVKGTVTIEQIEDLRDYLLLAAQDWYDEEAKK